MKVFLLLIAFGAVAWAQSPSCNSGVPSWPECCLGDKDPKCCDSVKDHGCPIRQQSEIEPDLDDDLEGEDDDPDVSRPKRWLWGGGYYPYYGGYGYYPYYNYYGSWGWGRRRRDTSAQEAPSSCAVPPPPCTTMNAPVCGSDGKTYPNECELAHASCKTPSLHMLHAGNCEAVKVRLAPSEPAPSPRPKRSYGYGYRAPARPKRSYGYGHA